MKPIKLVMSAFGPYAEKTKLNFEKLGEQGLFLITGDTGAGKTTIFDGVSFALFGEASGLTRTTDTLRSDFSSPETKTYVELTFSHRGELYKVTRNPKYLRPKKNREGFTTENADAVLNLPDKSVVTGIKEVSLRITEILGITYRQFKQIAMIAQGEFLQLLLADSKERGEIFRRVFGTEIYQFAARYLKDEELKCKKKCEESKRSIIQYFTGISIAQDDLGNKLLEKINNADVYSVEEIYENLIQVIFEDKKAEKQLLKNKKFIEKKITKNIESSANACTVNKMFEDLEIALSKKERLQANEEKCICKKEELKLAENALYNVYPTEKDYTREKELEKKLAEEIKILKEQISNKEGELKKANQIYNNEVELIPRHNKIAIKLDKLSEDLQIYLNKDELEKEIYNLHKKQSLFEVKIQAIKNELDTIINEKRQASKELENLKDIDIKISETTVELNKIVTIKDKLKKLKEDNKKFILIKKELIKLEENFVKIQKNHKNNNQVLLEKEISFFREQAGILAENLKDGQPCPVCGSNHHPYKAKISKEAPSEEKLNNLKNDVEKSREDMQKASEQIAVLKEKIGILEENLIKSIDEILPKIDISICKNLSEEIEESIKIYNQKIEQIESELKDLNVKNKIKIKCQKIIENSDEEIAEKQNNIAELEEEKNTVLAHSALKKGEFKSLAKSLEYRNKEDANQEIKRLSTELKQLKESFKKAEEQFNIIKNEIRANKLLLKNKQEMLTTISKSKNSYKQNFYKKLAENGFNNKTDYLAALRTQSQIDEIKQYISKYEDEEKAVKQEVNRLLKETCGKEKQDISKIENEKSILKSEKNRLDEAIQVVLLRLSANETVKKSLEEANKKFSDYQEEYLLIKNLSATANGEIAGKQKLPFEQYVQAAYFNYVLAEANKRFKVMTNGRYKLLRRENAENLRSQVGLEIDVLDYYTGRVRHVKSLSGGESFKASLALALGLSDVVQSYSGGVQVDTLFVDEGFGALDEESLEQAIQILSGLAEGNRLVGIISHINELKERIDKQIIVKKDRLGSSISIKN